MTIGRGVSVHRADCPNVAYMNATPGAHPASAVDRATPDIDARGRHRSRSRGPLAAASRHHGRVRRAQDAGELGERARPHGRHRRHEPDRADSRSRPPAQDPHQARVASRTCAASIASPNASAPSLPDRNVYARAYFALPVVAAFAAGAMNSVAGGGSFLTFPGAGLRRRTARSRPTRRTTRAMWVGTIGSARGYREEVARAPASALLRARAVSAVGVADRRDVAAR